jgi:dTDP-4-amino-4,6-dideoxygalactose transaminase
VTIPQFDLTRQYGHIGPEVERALGRVLRSGQFILGVEGAALEAECAAALSVAHAIGVGSGSDALKLVLVALDIGPGDEVVVPAFSFVSTATAVLQVGARPVFADVDPATLTLAPDWAATVITPRTRALLPVHLYGCPAAMGPLRVLAEERGIALIEDAAQAFGARLDGEPVGRLGRAAAFSFYPTKNLGAYGDAGLVTSDDADLAARVGRLRNHGQTGKYDHGELGWTSRLDEIQAAILRIKLRHLPEWTEARRRIAARYSAGLARCPLVLPAIPPHAAPVFHQYTIRTRRRDALAKQLADVGIGTACHYPQPLPAQPIFRELGNDPTDYPMALAASQEVLALPCFPELEEPEVEAVIAAIRDFFEGDAACGP